MTEHAAHLIARLDAMIHDRLKDCVEPDAPIALLDFPDIRNCGDSAIWLGEIAWLRKRFGKTPDFISRDKDLDVEALRAACPTGPIFIHGGGNFGDIWPGRQEFREHVIATFPDRPIVQMPQSIHFASEERLAQCARVIAGHRNFILNVRDQDSLALAQKHFDCEARLTPDMAFAIGPITGRAIDTPVLAMLREDAEKAGPSAAWVYPDVPKEDWITEQRWKVTLAKVRGQARGLLSGPAKRKFHRLNAVAAQRFGRGINQISRAKVIVTDRLHVHICSTLLGRPHAVLDNNYGKIRRLMDSFYPKGNPLAYRATSLSDAMDWAFEKERALREGADA